MHFPDVHEVFFITGSKVIKGVKGSILSKNAKNKPKLAISQPIEDR